MTFSNSIIDGYPYNRPKCREYVAMEWSATNGVSVHHPLATPQGLSGKRGWKGWESEASRDQSATVSSGHGRTATLVRSQQLQLAAQDEYKIKPVNIQARTERGSWAPNLTGELEDTKGLLEEANLLSLRVWLLEVWPQWSGWPHTQEYISNPN